jgi:hypothetical protein
MKIKVAKKSQKSQRIDYLWLQSHPAQNKGAAKKGCVKIARRKCLKNRIRIVDSSGNFLLNIFCATNIHLA